MTHSRQIARRALSTSTATFLSRLLGYVRDASVAHVFGGGALTDAFYAAFRVPNLFRRLLGEGPLTAAFVPVFTDELVHGREEEARRFFRRLFTVLLAVLCVLVALGVVFAPALVHLVAWGFKSDPGKFELTVRLTRLIFPFLLFICLAAVCSGALNARGRFFLPALAPAMLSVAEIVFVWGLARAFDYSLEGLAVSAAAGGFLHFAVLLPLLRREGLRPGWEWPGKDLRLLKVGRAVVPAVWGLSVDQIGAFVDSQCASFLAEGSVTALYNSNRVMQFPLALFGIALSTAALPSLSALVSRKDEGGLRETLGSSLRLVLFTVMPAMTGLLVLRGPVVAALFEHGRFTAAEAALTRAALAGYALGLPAFAAVKVMVSAFYARQDVGTPARTASLSLLVSVACDLALMWTWGVGGLALATSIGSTVNFAVLARRYGRQYGGWDGRRVLDTFWRVGLACLGMAGGVLVWMRWTDGGLLWRLPAAMALGVGLYAGLARLLRLEELDHLLDILRKKADAPA